MPGALALGGFGILGLDALERIGGQPIRRGTSMKLASLKHGRDGRLVVVSNDLAWYADAAHLCSTLQAALDDWDRIAPLLELLATDLRNEAIPRERFHEHDAAAPL